MAAGDLQRGTAEIGLSASATIFALATGAPPTAIAIVRIAGPAAFATLAALTRRPLPPARRMAMRVLSDPADGDILDHAVVVVFPAPRSATGDDMVELHLHGGVAIVAAVLGVLDRCGLTPAGPGAFTRRAFDNGKLDLGGAAALGDLIAAETDGQRRAALAQSGSDLGRRVDHWRATLTEVRADLEATLDFAEEEGVGDALTATGRARLAELAAEIATLRAAGDRGALLRAGLTIAIVGPANAGKSTLLNALARRDAAIVTPVAGTTRDLVEVRTTLGSLPVTLVDTAGLRPTDDPLEAEGIRRGVARAADAAIVIALGPTARDDAIGVAAKSDLRDDGAGWRDGVLHLSAATGAGIDLLEAEIAARIVSLTRPSDPPVVAHRWQMAALDAAAVDLGAALAATDAVIAAEALRSATLALARLIGRVASDDVLAEIFSRFCIGK